MNWPKGKPRGLKAQIPVGERFNRLTVVGRDYAAKGRVKWNCGFSSVSMPELTWGRRAGIPKNKLDAAIDAAIKEQT